MPDFSFIPRRARSAIYITLGVLVIIAGAGTAGIAATHVHAPTWWVFTVAIIGFLTPAGFAVATAHVPAAPVEQLDWTPAPVESDEPEGDASKLKTDTDAEDTSPSVTKDPAEQTTADTWVQGQTSSAG